MSEQTRENNNKQTYTAQISLNLICCVAFSLIHTQTNKSSQKSRIMSGRNHHNNSRRSNPSSSSSDNQNENNGFGVGAMLFATVSAAVLGGMLGFFAGTSEAEEEAQMEQAQRTVPVQPPTECSICWEPLGTRPLEQLPCSHLFHLSCLAQWFRTADGSSGPDATKSCPICRQPLTRRQLAIYQQRCGL